MRLAGTNPALAPQKAASTTRERTTGNGPANGEDERGIP